ETEEEAAERGAHDTDDDVEDRPLLPIRLHDEAGNPTHERTNHEPNDESDHGNPPSSFPVRKPDRLGAVPVPHEHTRFHPRARSPGACLLRRRTPVNAPKRTT